VTVSFLSSAALIEFLFRFRTLAQPRTATFDATGTVLHTWTKSIVSIMTDNPKKKDATPFALNITMSKREPPWAHSKLLGTISTEELVQEHPASVGKKSSRRTNFNS
jgi:hypothetical protein